MHRRVSRCLLVLAWAFALWLVFTPAHAQGSPEERVPPAVPLLLLGPQSPSNAAPIANPGADQRVSPGTMVTLNASASRDPEGHPLIYAWTLLQKPAGSAANLSDTTSSTPTFVADLAGIYEIRLVVNDGELDSSPATVRVTAANAAPVARAGDSQTVAIGATVHLDGSQSSDPDGDPLTYQWTLTAKPADSAATLSAPTSAAPTFAADKAGDYQVRLVVNDGHVDSVPATVVVTATNAAPVANVGVNRTVSAGVTVHLDGNQSSDADGHPLTYQWTLVAKPADSTATLSDPTSAAPTFVADKAGDYQVRLVVNDGHIDSSPAAITITAVTARNLSEVEPNDELESPQALGALILGEATVLQGNLSSGGISGEDYTGDVDVYVFDLPAFAELTVTIEWTGEADLDFGAMIWDELIGLMDGPEKPLSFSVELPPARYTIAVASKDAPCDYTIHLVAKAVAPASEEKEPNDTVETPTDLGVLNVGGPGVYLGGQVASGGMSPAGEYTGDIDLFIFRLDVTAQVTAIVSWGVAADLDLFVFNQEGALVGSEDTTAQPILVSDRLAPGLYALGLVSANAPAAYALLLKADAPVGGEVYPNDVSLLNGDYHPCSGSSAPPLTINYLNDAGVVEDTKTFTTSYMSYYRFDGDGWYRSVSWTPVSGEVPGSSYRYSIQYPHITMNGTQHLLAVGNGGASINIGGSAFCRQ